MLLVLIAPPAQAKRVISLNLCTDQLLVLLAPQDVTALEPLASDPALSFVAAQAKRLPSVRNDAEAVLRLHPDLVLAAPYAARTTVALLRAHGVRVVSFPDATDFPQIAARITALAALLGEPARGRALLAQMWRRLASVRKRHGSALFWEAGGWSAGPGSLADQLLRAAGLRDLGTGGRLGPEAVLALHPDFLVTQTTPSFPSMATDLADHPALRGLRRLHLDPALVICGGPFSAGAVEQLTR